MAYTPNQPPSDPAQIPAYLQSEFQKIALTLAGQQPLTRYALQSTLPPKPREGDSAYFAAGVVGTGSAQALYQYRSNAWVKLA